MKAFVLVVLLCAFRSTDAASTRYLTKTFTSADGFEIHLPLDWEEIPKATLAEYAEVVHKGVPNTAGKIISYGYHLATNSQQLGQPRILVMVDRTGMVSDAMIRAVVEDFKTRKLQEKSIDHALAGNTIGMRAEQTEVSYDESKRLLSIRISMQADDYGTIKGINSTYFTETGTVTILASAKAEEFDSFARIFEDVIAGVTFDSSLLTSQTTSNGSREDWLATFIKWAVIFMAALMFGLYQAIKPRLQKRAIERELKTHPVPGNALMEYRCEHCGKRIDQTLDMDGQVVTCPHCAMKSRLEL